MKPIYRSESWHLLEITEVGRQEDRVVYNRRCSTFEVPGSDAHALLSQPLKFIRRRDIERDHREGLCATGSLTSAAMSASSVLGPNAERIDKDSLHCGVIRECSYRSSPVFRARGLAHHSVQFRDTDLKS